MAAQITRDAVQSLLTWTQPECVSLYMPTHKAGADIRQDPIRFRNLLRKAADDLKAAGVGEGEVNGRLRGLNALADDKVFWQHQQSGLAAFIGPDQTQVYHLPYEVEELVIVADRPHVKPLLPLLGSQAHFYVLVLSQNSVRLLEATDQEVHEVDLGETPTSLAEAMKYNDPEEHLEFHTRTRPQGPGSDRRAMFFGQGVGTDAAVHKKNVLEFCRMIHNGVSKRLATADDPLILAGAEPMVGMYREVNQYAQLIDAGIPGSPDRKSPEDLHKEAMEIVQPMLRSQREQMEDRYAVLSNNRQASDRVEQINKAAHEGRIESLFVPVDEHLWGVYNAEKDAAEVHERRAAGDEDLLDLAAAETCRHGGTIFAVPRDAIPGSGKMAATFRYPT